ncbi:hypothetical protein XENOCAPTIV_012179, partial [Xenoophorus captivus]
DIRNTVGNIPMEWYKDFPHVGYNLDGKKIYKPIRNKDELDDFLEKMENPDYWKTVHDKKTSSDIVLSDEQIELVNRLQRGQFGDVNFNEYEPTVEFFSKDVLIHPVTNRPADKRSFIPSLIEKEKVSKLVHAIKMGWIKPRRVEDDSRGRFYDLWASESSSILAKHKMHLPAPKIPLPGHEESYNPPPEYMFTDEERALWEQQDPSDRRLPFVPKKYPSLRQVPAFSRFIHERFERCLDLYLDSAVLILSPALADKQVLLSELTEKYPSPQAVHQVTWHSKGDYLASVMPDHSSHLQVFIHQLSRRRSQNPFRRNKGLVQAVSFHPIRPYFFVATQRSVRIYNLVKQEMTKKLQANSKWISSIAVHSGG